MNLNVILSGHLTVSEQPAPGSPPPVTAADLKALGDFIVGAFEDKLAAFGTAIEASADAAAARSQADVTSLTAQVAALTASIQAADLTPEQSKALDDLQAKIQDKIDAIDTTKAATLPPTDGTTTTPPGDGTTPATPPDQPQTPPAATPGT